MPEAVLATRTTLWEAFRRSCTTARPIPLLPPVTMMTLGSDIVFDGAWLAVWRFWCLFCWLWLFSFGTWRVCSCFAFREVRDFIWWRLALGPTRTSGKGEACEPHHNRQPDCGADGDPDPAEFRITYRQNKNFPGMFIMAISWPEKWWWLCQGFRRFIYTLVCL